MALNLSDLPKDVRERIEAEHGVTARAAGPRAKPSRSETGPPTVGRCIPSDGTTCDWSGPYGAAWERHSKETGHGRLEFIIDTEHGSTER
jgi:hypothetical protein